MHGLAKDDESSNGCKVSKETFDLRIDQLNKQNGDMTCDQHLDTQEAQEQIIKVDDHTEEEVVNGEDL